MAIGLLILKNRRASSNSIPFRAYRTRRILVWIVLTQLCLLAGWAALPWVAILGIACGFIGVAQMSSYLEIQPYSIQVKSLFGTRKIWIDHASISSIKCRRIVNRIENEQDVVMLAIGTHSGQAVDIASYDIFLPSGHWLVVAIAGEDEANHGWYNEYLQREYQQHAVGIFGSLLFAGLAILGMLNI